MCTSAAKQWSIGADFRKWGPGPGPGSGPGSGAGPGRVPEGTSRGPQKGPKMALFWGLREVPKKGQNWPFFGVCPIDVMLNLPYAMHRLYIVSIASITIYNDQYKNPLRFQNNILNNHVELRCHSFVLFVSFFIPFELNLRIRSISE